MTNVGVRRAYVRRTANQLLRSAGVSALPVDLRLVAAACGLAYEEVDYFPDDVDALIVTAGNRAVAAFNRKQSLVRRRFSLAHEIGHYVLHRDGSVLEESVSIDEPPSGEEGSGSSVAEREANLFAGELLVPFTLLKQAFRPGITAADIGHAFDVSESVAAIALSSHLRALFKI